MARSNSRRRREQAVVHRRLPFNDSRDSIRLPVTEWGATSPSLDRRSAPAPSVHRLIRRLEQAPAFSWGMGRTSPMKPFDYQLTRWPVLPRLPVRLPIPPLQARNITPRFAGLNRLQVPVPRQVKFCVRRKQRREVLHALRIAGRRGLGSSGVRRTPNSAWGC